MEGQTPADVPYSLMKRLLATTLIVGLIGGVAGGVLVGRYGPKISSSDRKSIVLQDSSAVIDVIKNVSPGVVSITSTSSVGRFGLFGIQQEQTSAGTGMVVTTDGLILTNAHVVSGGGNFTVTTSDGKQYKNAKLVASDSARDIAFLRISAKGLSPVTLGDSASLQVGQRVIAIGNALGQFQNSATDGIISGLGRPVEAGDESGFGSVEALDNLIQTDAAINPGNSGGPLVNISGQVIGMNTAIAGQAQNIGFAIPINEVKSALDTVKTKGTISRPYLGVRYVQVTPDFAENNNLEVKNGAYVTGDRQNLAVLPGSPADKAGLEQGDLITKINNDSIDQTHTLSGLIGKHKVGDKIKVTYVRGGKTTSVDVTLEEAPTSQ